MKQFKVEIKNKNIHIHSDHYDIIAYVLSNKARIIENNTEHILKEKGVYIANINQEIDIVSNGQYALFYVEHYFLINQFLGRDFYFQCDSSKGYVDNIMAFTLLLKSIIQVYTNKEEMIPANKNKLFFELLLFIVYNYGIQKTHKNDMAYRIREYVYCNYQNNITLEEISSHFGMTPQYFSKLFKETIGTTFLKYLRNVQLENALNDYQNNYGNVLTCALSNGFPNINSFYAQLQKTTGLSLEEYIGKLNQKKESQAYVDLSIMEDTVKSNLEFKIDASKKHSYEPYWKKILNIPMDNNMNDIYVQQQITDLQKELRFEYARFYLWEGNENSSFFQEERVLDYLWKLNFKAWFVLDLRNNFNMKYFDHLLSHFSNRYSLDTIRNWKFEVVYNTIFNEEKLKIYAENIRKLRKILNKYQCTQNVLGAGLLLSGLSNIEYFTDHIQNLNGYTFISNPYIYDISHKNLQRTKDMQFLKNCIQNVSECVNGDVYISEWNDSVFDYSSINDSCYRGALIVKTIIDNFGKMNGLACGNPLDIMSERAKDSSCLFGYSGLVSKHGIKKPSFYAYSFLNRLGTYYLGKSQHSIVMSNGQNNYQILCHNCKTLNYKYYLNELNDSYQDVSEFFDDLDNLKLEYSISNVRNGTYICKIRTISTQFGSVQDAFLEMVEEGDNILQESEIDYLKRISTPKEKLKKIVVEDHTLRIYFDLSPNEFCYAHLIYQY